MTNITPVALRMEEASHKISTPTSFGIYHFETAGELSGRWTLPPPDISLFSPIKAPLHFVFSLQSLGGTDVLHCPY